MTGVGLGGETPLEAEMADTGTEEQGGEDEYHHHLLAPRQKEHRVRINRVRDHASAGRDGTAKCAPRLLSQRLFTKPRYQGSFFQQ